MIKFKKHKFEKCPVPLDAKVIYRTMHKEVVSHVHAPITAGLLNWTTRCSIGRIHEYAVVG